jgi:hypothetical protein
MHTSIRTPLVSGGSLVPVRTSGLSARYVSASAATTTA